MEEIRNKVKFGNVPTLPYAIEEAINRLRINISFLGRDVKKIMVISSEPNEGKSFISWHLWSQLARAGEKCLLIDGDMRNSTYGQKYAMEREDGKELKGISHYLSGNVELDEVLMHTDNKNGDILINVENVVNPSMLLEKKQFATLLEEVAKDYRYVFIDAPPLSLVSDGELIGSYCDGAILSVRSGVTPKSAVREAVSQLERAGCPLLGIVLNRVGDSKSGYYHGRYGRYGHYGKYGGKYGEYYGTGSR